MLTATSCVRLMLRKPGNIGSAAGQRPWRCRLPQLNAGGRLISCRPTNRRDVLSTSGVVARIDHAGVRVQQREIREPVQPVGGVVGGCRRGCRHRGAARQLVADEAVGAFHERRRRPRVIDRHAVVRDERIRVQHVGVAGDGARRIELAVPAARCTCRSSAASTSAGSRDAWSAAASGCRPSARRSRSCSSAPASG